MMWMLWMLWMLLLACVDGGADVFVSVVGAVVVDAVDAFGDVDAVDAVYVVDAVVMEVGGCGVAGGAAAVVR